jgi:hypothetical protein
MNSSSEDDDPEFSNIVFPQDTAMQQVRSSVPSPSLTLNAVSPLKTALSDHSALVASFCRLAERAAW